MSITWEMTLRRKVDGSQVQDGMMRVIKQKDLDDSRGRDTLLIEYHAREMYRTLKEQFNERKDQD